MRWEKIEKSRWRKMIVINLRDLNKKGESDEGDGSEDEKGTIAPFQICTREKIKMEAMSNG